MAKKTPSKVTIVEVAEKAGVSLGTVSRVMNNDIHVAPETREHVSTVMREMGYVANRQARSLKSSRTNVIGILAPDLGTGYIGEILHGVDTELGLHQFDLMLFTTHRTAIKEANYVAHLVRGMVDGYAGPASNPADYTVFLRTQISLCLN
jgi:LacI family transcriptional regulator